MTTEKKYNVFDYANYFISLSLKQTIDDNAVEGITHLKLQKILYFAQAAHLAIHDTSLFDEEIQAWKYGPVIPVIYDSYKTFGNSNLALPEEYSNDFDKETVKFLDGIWELFSKYSASELISISHNHKPWIDAFKSGTNTVIEQNTLKEYYKNIFEYQDEE
jgi:uncharacterized phage-associated protein